MTDAERIIIEQIIDREGIYHVLHILSLLCDEKADHAANAHKALKLHRAAGYLTTIACSKTIGDIS